MKSDEYRKLCRKVMRRFGKSLNLLYVDACELADDVFFGDITEARLWGLLEAAERDENEGDMNIVWNATGV